MSGEPRVYLAHTDNYGVLNVERFDPGDKGFDVAEMVNVYPDVIYFYVEAPDPVALPPVGSIVTPTGMTYLPDGVYTVIGHTDATRICVVQIGDTSGRYYRTFARGVMPLEGALDALLALQVNDQ